MNPFPPQLPAPSSLWLANVTAVAILVSLVALLAERVLRQRSLPTRHSVLLTGVFLTAISPLLLLVAMQLGWGVVVPLRWEEAVIEAPARQIAAVPRNEPPPHVEPERAVPLIEISPRPLTVGDVVPPGEVLQFDLSPPVVDESPAVLELPSVDPPSLAVMPSPTSSEPRFVDWRPAASTIGGWWLVIWGVGTLVAALRLLIGWRRVRRMRSELVPINHPALLEALNRAANVVGLASSPRLMTSSRIPVPVVCGLRRPVVILPCRLVEEVPAASIESILLHECAHLQRRDLWIGWMQRLAGVLFWWNVPLRIVQQRLNDVREDLCDNHVLAHHPDGRGYARVLLDLVSRASGARPVPASAGFVEGPSSGLSARITRLLKEDRDMATRLTRGPAVALALLAMLMGAAICGLTLRPESAIADDASDSPIVNESDADARNANSSGEAAASEAAGGEHSVPPEPLDQRVIVAPLYYDDQMLVLVTQAGAAAVRFERIDNGKVNYDWRYLSREAALLDPKAVPSPHEQMGEGQLEQIMFGPMPLIQAGPINLLWHPGTEMRGWVSFSPEEIEVLPVNPESFGEQKIPSPSSERDQPEDVVISALDLRSFFAEFDSERLVTEEGSPGPAPPHYSAKVAYVDMVLVVAKEEGVAAFEFCDPFVEGDLQANGRDGVRYRGLYRAFDGADEAVGFSEVYELYKDGNYTQGQLYLEAGAVELEWSKGDTEYGWVYFNPLEERCWLIERECFEEFLTFNDDEGNYQLDLLRFRHAARPLTPSVDVSQVADPVPVAMADDADHEFAQQVDQAIERGVAFLVENQSEGGTWDPDMSFPQHEVGLNSLAILSLLASGRPVEDPTVANGLQWLRQQQDPDETYDISLMLIALAATNDENDQARIQGLTNLLQETQVANQGLGAWGYGAGGGSWWDNSNTQYAVMGLYAAHQVGAAIDCDVLRRSLDHYVARQQGDASSRYGAGWNYQGEAGGVVSGTMTTAGIASILMLTEMLKSQDDLSDEDAVRLESAATSLEAGQRWLASHFAVRSNPGAGQTWVLCYLTSLGRACTLAELELVGDHDWYREGAEYLVDGQNSDDGSWDSLQGSGRVIDTSLAILFLCVDEAADEAVSIVPEQSRVFVFDFENASWSDVLQQLSDSAGINIEVSERNMPEGTFSWHDERHYSGEQSLQLLNHHLRQRGCELVQEGDLYRLMQRPAVPPTDPFVPAAVEDNFGPSTPTVSDESASNVPAGRSGTILLVHLAAASDGTLGEVRYFNESLGAGPAAMEGLTARIEELEAELQTRREFFGLSVQLTADESLQYGAVIAVMDALNSGGVRDIHLSTGPTGDEISISLGFLRDAMGRKISDGVILSVPDHTGSVDSAEDILRGLSHRMFSERTGGEGLDAAADVVLTINVDAEVPADVVQGVTQAASAAGFAKFKLQSLGGETTGDAASPGDPTSNASDDMPGSGFVIAGEVLLFDGARQLVSLSMEADDDIRVGQRYIIWRHTGGEWSADTPNLVPYRFIGECEVTVVNSDQCVARIESLSRDGTPPQGGDVVTGHEDIQSGETQSPNEPQSSVEPPAAESNIAGTVISYDEHERQLRLSLGEGEVERFQGFSIWRSREPDAGYDWIAICVVSHVMEDESLAFITNQIAATVPRQGDELVKMEAPDIRFDNAAEDDAESGGEPQSFDHPPDESPREIARRLESSRQLIAVYNEQIEDLLETYDGEDVRIGLQIERYRSLISLQEDTIRELESQLPAATEHELNYINELRHQLVDLRRQHDELLSHNVAPSHPEVMDLHERIAVTEAELSRLAPDIPPQEFESPAFVPSSAGERELPMTDEERLAALIESSLGMRLAPIAADDARLDGTPFRGGLEVVDLLPRASVDDERIRGTLPGEEGIREGDILVGLEQWETVSLDNVAFVLTQPESGNFMRIRFYIVRDGQTIHGHIVPDSFPKYGAESYNSEPLAEQVAEETAGIVQLRYLLPEGCFVMHQLAGDRRRERIAVAIGESVESYIYPGNASRWNMQIIVTPSPPATRAAVEFLDHNAIPVQVTRDDLDAVLAGQHVVRVIYFPADQDEAGVCEAISSTRLEAGVDPVAEAQTRGDVLAVIHLSHPGEASEETEEETE